MKGIALSRSFYWEVVRPWLDARVPGLPHAAALIGYGSELLGLDDEMSRDHNWGPRVELLVSRDAFDRHAFDLVDDFARVVPESFCGEPIGWRSRPNPPAAGPESVGSRAHGLEIHTMEARLGALLGIAPDDPPSAMAWLGFAEQRLLAVTAGEVFHDDDGRLTQLRAQLSYFPKDVWLYKIACQWRRIAEEQAFVGRTGSVGDDLGSRIVAGRLSRDVMRMGFLLDRTYAPYAKWLGSAFARLPCAAELTPHLAQALGAADWQTRGEALAASYLALAKRQVAHGIGKPFEPVIGPYFDRPFPTINADEAVRQTREAITDPVIRHLPVIGSADQVIDSTPVLEDPVLTAKMMRALLP